MASINEFRNSEYPRLKKQTSQSINHNNIRSHSNLNLNLNGNTNDNKSSIFKNLIFLVYNSSENSRLMKAKQMIKEQKGKVVTNSKELEGLLRKVENQKNSILIVVDDGYIQPTIAKVKELKEKVKNALKLVISIEIISHRWVDYSVDVNKPVLDFKKKDLFQLIPFKHKTPFSSFQSLNIYVSYLSGTHYNKKKSFRQILQTLGAKQDFDLESLDILICERKESSKY